MIHSTSFESQAAPLRSLFKVTRPEVLFISLDANRSHEVGFAAKLSAGFGQLGQRVLLIDFSGGKTSQQLGIRTRFDLAQVLDGAVKLTQACVKTNQGFLLLSALRAYERGVLADPKWPDHLGLALRTAGITVDRVVVLGDTRRLSLLGQSAGTATLVLGDLDQSGLSATYQRIKQLQSGYGVNRCAMVYLRVRDLLQAASGHDYLCHMTRRFLGVDLELAGVMSERARNISFREMARMLTEPNCMRVVQ